MLKVTCVPFTFTTFSSSSGNAVVLKVGVIGDASVGKTCLMVSYVDNTFNEDYIATLGVQYKDKVVNVKGTQVTFNIWDLGGKEDFASMLPHVCNGAHAIIFTFDLSRPNTLNALRAWFTQVRNLNETAIAILVGTKFDIFATLPKDQQEQVTKKARKYAKAMKAPVIFSSSKYSINIKKIFKIILAKSFNLTINVPQISEVGHPILEYEST